MRSQNVRSAEQIAEVRLRVWAIKIDLDRAVEITFSNAHQFGLEPEDLISTNHGACRELANRFREEPGTPDTLIVPSAALPGTRNVVILGERVSIPYSFEPIDSVDLPASTVAERSRPPVEIESLVCFQAEPNPEYDAWRNGAVYEFPDI